MGRGTKLRDYFDEMDRAIEANDDVSVRALVRRSPMGAHEYVAHHDLQIQIMLTKSGLVNLVIAKLYSDAAHVGDDPLKV